MKKIIFVLVVMFSVPVLAEHLNVKVEECAKWLMGADKESTLSSRAEAAVLCAGGSTIECAKWVIGNQPDTYRNREEAIKACATRGWRR